MGNERYKLRTYKTLKYIYETETYINMIKKCLPRQRH